MICELVRLAVAIFGAATIPAVMAAVVFRKSRREEALFKVVLRLEGKRKGDGRYVDQENIIIETRWIYFVESPKLIHSDCLLKLSFASMLHVETRNCFASHVLSDLGIDAPDSRTSTAP